MALTPQIPETSQGDFLAYSRALYTLSASPWSEESLSGGELSPTSIVSCLWPRRILDMGFPGQEESCVELPFLGPRYTCPEQLSWETLSILAAKRVYKEKKKKKKVQSDMYQVLEVQL